jgi:hypothetical protein
LTGTLYLNGVDEEAIENGVTPIAPTYTGVINTGTIGAYQRTTLVDKMNGLIDEVLIFDRKLTSEEVSWLYNEGNGRKYIDI